MGPLRSAWTARIAAALGLALALGLVLRAGVSRAVLVHSVLMQPMPSQEGQVAKIVDQRFASVRPMLAGRRSIGYAAPRPPLASSKNDMLMYYLVQYALAPVLVTLEPHQSLVIACFGTDEELNDFVKAGSFVVRTQIAKGAAVVEKASP